MVDSDQEKERTENLRVEYSAVVNYHNDLVKSRFTIAGFYVATIGFVMNAAFNENSTPIIQLICSFAAFWIALCLWIMELRSRSLYVNLAHRCINIEHHHWNLKGSDWYEGFFSRQYKEEPSEEENDSAGMVPQKPKLDSPKLAWAKKALSPKFARYISHSWGFDLLYPGTGLFWLVMFIVSFVRLLT
jgi:hypothetical protein